MPLFALLFLLAALLAQSFLPPFLVLFACLGALALFLSFARPLWMIFALSVYLPFESFLLRFATDESYPYLRFFPEVILYALALAAFFHHRKHTPTRHIPGLTAFAFFCLTLFASSLINFLPFAPALAGIRQIIRFPLLYFILVAFAPPRAFVTKLLGALLGIGMVQAFLGLFQTFTGGNFDHFFLPSETRSVGDISLGGSVAQTWEPGSRAFGTLGRYDRLGNFLAVLLPTVVAFFYEKVWKERRVLLLAVLSFGTLALLLTQSRASWFAFLIGLLFVGVYLFRDRRLAIGIGAFALMAVAFVWVSGIRVGSIAEVPGQSLGERFYETFSITRWRGEYYGVGRIFWMIETPLRVISASPLFGFGPSQFGGGAAAALHQTRVYDALALPFGVYGTEGIIDNNWFSLWGEAGTLGLIAFLVFYITVFRRSLLVAKEGKDAFDRALGAGACAALFGLAFIALLSTAFEIRTTALYVWLLAGIAVSRINRA